MSSASAPFGSTSTQGFVKTASSTSPFGQTASSATPFGQNTKPTASPFGQAPTPAAPMSSPFGSNPNTSAISGAPTTFGGKTARELLFAFYQQRNPSKIAEVDKLLAKYAGKEEQMFRNLAKKYNLDPSVFSLGAAAPAPTPAFGAPPIGQPAGFGQASTMSGGFGNMASAPSTAGFGSFGQSPQGGTSGFGSLSTGGTPQPAASAPSTTGFGSFGQSPQGSTSGFGGTPQPAPGGGFGSMGNTGFGSPAATPFGAARR